MRAPSACASQTDRREGRGLPHGQAEERAKPPQSPRAAATTAPAHAAEAIARAQAGADRGGTCAGALDGDGDGSLRKGMGRTGRRPRASRAPAGLPCRPPRSHSGAARRVMLTTHEGASAPAPEQTGAQTRRWRVRGGGTPRYLHLHAAPAGSQAQNRAVPGEVGRRLEPRELCPRRNPVEPGRRREEACATKGPREGAHSRAWIAEWVARRKRVKCRAGRPRLRPPIHDAISAAGSVLSGRASSEAAGFWRWAPDGAA